MWISVLDKFPNKDGKYLAVTEGFNNNYNIEILYFDRFVKYESYYYDQDCWDKKNIFTRNYSDDFSHWVKNVIYWDELPELPVHYRKCKDCSACHLSEYKRKNKENETYIAKRYECWGVKEPFEIKDINQNCTEY